MRATSRVLLAAFAIACCLHLSGCNDNLPGCLVDMDCPASQICDQGQCVNHDCPGGCPAGKYCSGNNCAICQDDWHCGDQCLNCKGNERNKICLNGACGCIHSDDCGTEESCVEGTCQNVALCGNGKIDPGETCGETELPTCPDDCDDGNPCTTDILTGIAQNCNADCSHSTITQCLGGDGCCPSGCTFATDGDCPDPCQAHCQNDMLDCGETDLNCGGGTCGACSDCRSCLTASDCISLVCLEGHCRNGCFDGLKDGDESDMDCGGSCPSCTSGQVCRQASDCASASCSQTRCQESDGQKPWEKSGITACWIDNTRRQSSVVSRDRFWMQDISDADYRKWRWIDNGVLSDGGWFNAPAIDGVYPWSGTGLSAAWILESTRRFTAVNRDRYWTMDMSNADWHQWNWVEWGYLNTLLSDAPAVEGTKPWESDGVTAGYVDQRLNRLTVYSRTKYWMLNLGTGTWIASGALGPQAGWSDAPSVDGVFPWDNLGVTGTWLDERSPRRFGVFSGDKYWVMDQESAQWQDWHWIGSGYLKDAWPTTPFNCRSIGCTDQRFISLADKVGALLDDLDIAYPLEQQPGGDADGNGSSSDTLASLDALHSSESKEQQAEYRGRLFCAPPPVGGNAEDWAVWRYCLATGHTVLAWHFAHHYLKDHTSQQLERAATHLYLLTLQLDSFTTGGENSAPLSGLISWYPQEASRLRDTMRVARYLPDGNGWFLTWAWLFRLGIMPCDYQTPLEEPKDAGKSYRTINLCERVRQVSSAIASKAASEWMYKSAGNLRTEYWDNTRFWAQPGYAASPNRDFPPAAGVGTDLTGRRTMGQNLPDQSMSPHFFHWQMSGMATAAKLVQDAAPYADIYDFGLTADAHTITLDRNNPSTYAALNPFGQPVRGLSIACDGTLNASAASPQDICTGGTREWFDYGPDASPMNRMTGLAYSAQHLSGLMGTLAWSHQLPAHFSDNAITYAWAFQSTYHKDGMAYLNWENGGFAAEALEAYAPGSVVACNYCNTSPPPAGCPGFFFQTNNGRVVNSGGETAAELIGTLVPPFAHIVAQNDFKQAHLMLDELEFGMDGLRHPLLDPHEASCASTWGLIANDTLYNRRAIQFANLMVSYFLLRKIEVPVIPH